MRKNIKEIILELFTDLSIRTFEEIIREFKHFLNICKSESVERLKDFDLRLLKLFKIEYEHIIEDDLKNIYQTRQIKDNLT